jgi:light-regulated signal transduction histidine kinase (bacteriophytochrome)
MENSPRPAAEIERELELTRAQLDEMRARLDNYIQRMSHDIQAPVKKILSFADLLVLKLQSETDESVREYLRRIEKNAAILSQLLRELRDEAKPQG